MVALSYSQITDCDKKIEPIYFFPCSEISKTVQMDLLNWQSNHLFVLILLQESGQFVLFSSTHILLELFFFRLVLYFSRSTFSLEGSNRNTIELEMTHLR